jgi:hypothetical protein
MTWHEYQDVYDAHADHLHWQQASFLSIEQRRRRQTNSSLPREHYRIAVLKHEITDAGTGQRLPGRLIFVHSSVNAKFACERRDVQIAKIRAGLEDLVGRVQRAHALVTPESISTVRFSKRSLARPFPPAPWWLRKRISADAMGPRAFFRVAHPEQKTGRGSVDLHGPAAGT